MSLCLDCGKSLLAKAKQCSCGWIKQEASAQPVIDSKCQYVIHQRRCPLPGTMSSSLRVGGYWYCSEHWHALGNPKLGEAVLLYAEQNYQHILENRRDWREKLFEGV